MSGSTCWRLERCQREGMGGRRVRQSGRQCEVLILYTRRTPSCKELQPSLLFLIPGASLPRMFRALPRTVIQ